MPLPKNWKPKYLNDLIRIGSQRDGGYILPKRILKKTKYLISFGLGDDWTFEEHFQQESGAAVVCYDHTITTNYWRKRFIKSWISLISGKGKKAAFNSFFDYFRYKRFFDEKKASHFLKKIGYAHLGEIDIKSIIQKDSLDLFLKVDIEGAEYRILDQILEFKSHLIGFVIEFHDVDILSSQVSDFVEQAKENFTLVHIHANNCGGVDHEGNPIVLEMTWIKNDQIGPDEGLHLNAYPIEGLDQANSSEVQDIELSFST